MGCQVTVKNMEYCGDMGDYGAYCFDTLQSNERQIDKEQWDVERFGQVCTKAENYAEMKKILLQLCSQTNCKYEDVQKKLVLFEHGLNNYNNLIEGM